jgi:hypothetical protein
VHVNCEKSFAYALVVTWELVPRPLLASVPMLPTPLPPPRPLLERAPLPLTPPPTPRSFLASVPMLSTLSPPLRPLPPPCALPTRVLATPPQLPQPRPFPASFSPPPMPRPFRVQKLKIPPPTLSPFLTSVPTPLVPILPPRPFITSKPTPPVPTSPPRPFLTTVPTLPTPPPTIEWPFSNCFGLTRATNQPDRPGPALPLPLTAHYNFINKPSNNTLSRPASVLPCSAQLLASVLASAVTWDPQQRHLLTPPTPTPPP